jgi:hypothetical protein
MKKLISFVSVLALGLLAACGGSMDNPSAVITCTDFTILADRVSYDDEVTVLAVDGNGNVLYRELYSASSTSNFQETFGYTARPQANPIYIRVNVTINIQGQSTEYLAYDATGNCPGLDEGSAPPPFGFTDGRLNHRDIAAPFAIFPTPDGLQLYWINADSTGSLALSLTQAELDAVPADPAQHTLIASNATYGLSLYRLMDGQLQAQAVDAEGKLYVYIFG